VLPTNSKGTQTSQKIIGKLEMTFKRVLTAHLFKEARQSIVFSWQKDQDGINKQTI